MDAASLSSLPTDSLYKFVALSGLFVLIGCALIIEYFRKSASVRYFSSKKLVGSQGVRLHWMNDELESLKRRFKEFEAEIQEYGASLEEDGIDPDIAKVEKYRARAAENGRLISEQKRRIEEEQILAAQLSVEVEELEYLARQLVQFQRLRVVAIIIGLLLSFSGFYLWYTKIQIYSDASLRAGINCPNISSRPVL